MEGSGESRFYKAVESQLQDADAKAAELERYARLSFSLDVSTVGTADHLVLRHSIGYSLCKDVLSDVVLGSLPFSLREDEAVLFKGRLSCPKFEMEKVAGTLVEVIQRYETPPKKGRKQWDGECFVGEGLLPTPVAVHNIGYFQSVRDKRNISLAPGNLQVYKTNDIASKRFLQNLLKLAGSIQR